MIKRFRDWLWMRRVSRGLRRAGVDFEIRRVPKSLAQVMEELLEEEEQKERKITVKKTNRGRSPR